MEKRYILAVVLMILVMFGWSYWFGQNLPKPNPPGPAERAAEQSKEASPSPSDGVTTASKHPAEMDEPIRPQPEFQQSKKVHVQTENYDITFVEEFAIAQRWVLKKYPNRSGVGEESINLIPEAAQNCLSVRLFDPQLEHEAMGAIWTADKTRLILTDRNPQDTLTFSTQIGADLKILKKFTFYQRSYYVDLELVFRNLSDQRVISLDTMSNNRNGYKLRWGPGISADLLPHELKSGKRERHNPKSEGAKAYTGLGKPVKEFDESQLTETIFWTGVNSKYFAVIMIPNPPLNAQYQREILSDNGETPSINITAPDEAVSLIIPGFSLDSHQSRTNRFRVYVGPKAANVLKKIRVPVLSSIDSKFQGDFDNNSISTDLRRTLKNEGLSLSPNATVLVEKEDSTWLITDSQQTYTVLKEKNRLSIYQVPSASRISPRLSKIIDFGFFWPIAWAMLWLLNGFHRIIGNYGVAIILLTLSTKLISYPLTRKSYKSMKEMQKLQPLLTELREQYRDDPQKLNKATMQLYKEHGVNPLGGCIPWLPQMPIFFALFSLLGSAVELRGAPFVLWIDDLAAPDVLFTLPFTIPFVGNAFRILPIVNGLTTWLQQRMTGGMTPATDNTQAKIMQFLPFLFVFLFYNWASGFVLYWLCNNAFTIGQQYLTTLKGSDETEPVKTLPAKGQSQPKKRNPSNVKRKK